MQACHKAGKRGSVIKPILGGDSSLPKNSILLSAAELSFTAVVVRSSLAGRA